MKQIASLGTSALLAAALWATPASQPGAQSLLHVSGGYRTAPQHGHRRRHHQGPTYSHGVPFMKRRRRAAPSSPVPPAGGISRVPPTATACRS